MQEYVAELTLLKFNKKKNLLFHLAIFEPLKSYKGTIAKFLKTIMRIKISNLLSSKMIQKMR